MIIKLDLQFFNDDVDYVDIPNFKNKREEKRWKRNWKRNAKRYNRSLKLSSLYSKARNSSDKLRVKAGLKYDKFKNDSKKFLSKKNNRSLVYRLFGLVSAILFAVLAFGDGTLKFIESYKATIHSDNYSYNNGDITFYNYDWEFKLKQLSNFAPMFSIDSGKDSELSPTFYKDSLTRLYSNGDIIYDGNWSISDFSIDDEFVNRVYSYRYKFRGNSQTIRVIDFFSVSDGKIIISNSTAYDKWVNQYNQRADASLGGFGESTLILLNLPVNLTYNMYCLFDFILRW